MKPKKYLLLFLISISSILFAGDKPKKETHVLIKTTFGDIIIKLYNETPKHRDNFIKLVKKGTYDSLLFHRVIQNFMIQGGDPDSRRAEAGKMLGEGDVGYTIPAEFVPSLYHKKGVIAAARNGDLENPTLASSGCQFYIVQGKVFTDSTLMLMGNRIAKQQISNEVMKIPANKLLRERILKNQMEGRMDSVQMLSARFRPQQDSLFAARGTHKFSEQARNDYKTIGGTPHLDGAYTVYGEVVEGMDIVEKIAAVKVDANARPLSDVRIFKMEILKKVKKQKHKKEKSK